MGCENPYKKYGNAFELGVNPGLGIGACQNMDFYKEILDVYSALKFKNLDGSLNLKTVVQYTTELALPEKSHQYPRRADYSWNEYIPTRIFFSQVFRFRKNHPHDSTRSIHHFSMSWMSSRAKTGVAAERILRSLFGTRFVNHLKSIYYKSIYPILTKK